MVCLKYKTNYYCFVNDFEPFQIVQVSLHMIYRRRDFLWAEISEDWTGPPTPKTEATITPDEVSEDKETPTVAMPPPLIKEETLENALINLKKFYRWSRDSQMSCEHYKKEL